MLRDTVNRGLQISAIDSPPDGARVGHYDQLGESAKAKFPALVPADDGGSVMVDEDRDEFGAFDVVKFTRYYRITSTAAHSSLD